MAEANINSVLVADIGSVHTRLVLVDVVEGQYRLVGSARARTTAEPPLGSVSMGLERAAQNLTAVTGRQILDLEADQLLLTPEAGGMGIDAFLATSSAGRPLRVLLVGLTPEISLASAERMLAGSYVTITDVLNPDDRRSEEEKINAVLGGNPDLIVIVGGTNDGADEILLNQIRMVERALSLIQRGPMPQALYAGNEALIKRVKALLGPYTNVLATKNVRPTLDHEQIFPAQEELAMAFDEYRARGPGGFAEIGRASMVGVVPTPQGLLNIVRYMAELPRSGLGPLIIDVGSANSMIVASVNKETHYRIRTDLGLGHNAPSALQAVTASNAQRWLTFDLPDDALLDYVLDKQISPATIPNTAEDLMIEQALAREIARLMFAEARPSWNTGVGDLLPNFQPVIGTGAALTEAQHPGMSALLLLDALQPTGTVELLLDPHNLLSALGVAAYLKPVITVQALEAGGLINLGTAFCPLGRSRQGKESMRITIRQADGKVINQTLMGGEIWMAPALPGTACEVTVRLAGDLSINGKRRLKKRVVAGAAGIIFDARGRPLHLPRSNEQRIARLTEWQQAMSGRAPLAARALAGTPEQEGTADAVLS